MRNVHLYRRQQDTGSVPQPWRDTSYARPGGGRVATFLPTFAAAPLPRLAAVTITGVTWRRIRGDARCPFRIEGREK